MVEMLLCAIKHGKSGFVKWAIQKNPMTINELLNQGYFDNAIYRAITRDNLKYLELELFHLKSLWIKLLDVVLLKY